ncbi:ADP-forming succinate--CoA ligase subunit beta [Gimesia maris]|uniref:Succinate--CoA ligase [ADP-forming] subunit beta n=1 Tax=Gimesia maris TaxID=122 RepID=A0ABX5YIG5_9PLAN|nr:ADP-forming succinate--CoA ligase subunit beta [Gimesia maris]HAW29577.1 ADP-forming succinate--CoA ligase subunit beta [Planctomycetaceae bacterium]EDL58308.1 succinyl-CoA synthetase (beta subunit) [Gimesia maris DSM 8797]QDT77900.1 Succinyl-CoA ligase [ADP-forming] subunit beta [Gimesia maris]QDU13561.1 Succinyl-CoA ligase [ADP-forming] subunit beta [Gimesia maris]QEG15489.1 Succinyl-CoA ligase [ADP-forming] subunit beta [Gimesia maris]|tara:strand:+ start:1709 stop:2896 length:1188 start_codon:yes stop_codon:yes gene_type:complete
MKIHEYQAKQLFREAGIPVPEGIVAKTVDEAVAAFEKLDRPLVVVKSQIHAGGRGKGRFKEYPEQAGVVLARSAEEVRENAERMLGSTLVTIQTGEEGKQVNTLFIEQGLDIAQELYLGCVVDREAGGPVLILSTEGGMEIEVVAEESPEKILSEPFSIHTGLLGFQARKLAFKLGMEGKTVRSAEKFLCQMSRFFIDNDCSMTEINPLVITGEGELVALDAKVSFDENAMFRHKPLEELRDLTEEEPAEVDAGNAGLSYVKLDGNIGCLVNGAGLAMSTMDLIKHHGGEPANFLDVGGGANVDQVSEAFRIILADDNVKAVLVNIFGGIMKCDTIVTALLEAYEKVGFTVPLVVRLEGTNVDKAREMLAGSGRDIISATDLTDAAQKVVATLSS